MDVGGNEESLDYVALSCNKEVFVGQNKILNSTKDTFKI